MKKFGYYKRSGGAVRHPELIREFEAEQMRHDKDYVTFFNNDRHGNAIHCGAIHLDKGEWVEEIKQ